MAEKRFNTCKEETGAEESKLYDIWFAKTDFGSLENWQYKLIKYVYHFYKV